MVNPPAAHLFVSLIVIVFLAASVTTGQAEDFDATKDVELTWDNAVIRILGLVPVETRPDQVSSLLPPNARIPTIVYMHGGGGLSPDAYEDLKVVAKIGFAVIAPKSFARKRPVNPGIDLSYTCPDGRCWNLERSIFALRTAELAYALERVRLLPWVDRNNIFVWGHSEGGYTVAAYKGAVSKARLITGTGCAYGFHAEEPALAVISRDDAYVARHRLEFTRPSTCKKIAGDAKNLTYIEIPGKVHNGAQTEAGGKAVLEFLQRHNTSSWVSPILPVAVPQEKQDVDKTIVGKTLVLKFVMSGYGGRVAQTQFVYYDPNGMFVKTLNEPNTYDYGRYKINENGSHCYFFESKDDKACWTIVKYGNLFYLDHNNGKYSAEITSEDGDTHRLMAAGAEAKKKAAGQR